MKLTAPIVTLTAALALTLGLTACSSSGDESDLDPATGADLSELDLDQVRESAEQSFTELNQSTDQITGSVAALGALLGTNLTAEQPSGVVIGAVAGQLVSTID